MRIALSGVTKGWGGTSVIDNLALDVPAGKFTAILGPSGCGKSTLLRLIAGLDRPDRGRIMMDGQDVTDLPPAGRNVAMVFQSYALFPHLTVAENILFGMKVRRTPRPIREASLARAAEMLELTPLLARKPSQLSGGQQQRVALARAIVAEKSVFLMDEPLSNLDARLRQDMRAEIRDLQRKLGVTMV
ncbi:MAG: ABC transporter ATP-binding protein, partial [Paracoccaceae bacterium]